MVTFCIIWILLAAVGAIALGILFSLGIVLSGVAVIVMDIVIGLLPFAGLFLVIRWLFKKKEGGENDERKTDS